ncbi:MAG TPA: hypothetical protein VJ740_05930 [Hyphomicrobiaceae bacterium]|nr:hypothetical protein [Hyphomicrobiaceae bacterium]
MIRLASASLGAIALLGAATTAHAGWDDSYRYCPGAWGCPSAYYSLPLHGQIYEYRVLLPHNRNLVSKRPWRRSRCVTNGHFVRCR